MKKAFALVFLVLALAVLAIWHVKNTQTIAEGRKDQIETGQQQIDQAVSAVNEINKAAEQSKQQAEELLGK